MNNTTQENERKVGLGDSPRQESLCNIFYLQKLSPKHRREYFEVKPILDSLGIELSLEDVRDKPDFKFFYEGKTIGLESTRCYPPDAQTQTNQNRYEIGEKGVRAIVEEYKEYKKERGEWVTLSIKFKNGLYYALRDASLTKDEIKKIETEVIEEIEMRLRRGHFSSPETCDKPVDESWRMGLNIPRQYLVTWLKKEKS